MKLANALFNSRYFQLHLRIHIAYSQSRKSASCKLEDSLKIDFQDRMIIQTLLYFLPLIIRIFLSLGEEALWNTTGVHT